MIDVARAAGVHQTTVSLALRNDPRLPAETRERIRNLAREMGYRPNPLVSALVSHRKKPGRWGGTVIAFVTSHQTPDGWRISGRAVEVFEAVKRRASELGYGVEEFWAGSDGAHSERVIRILMHRGIRAVIMAPLEGRNRKLDWVFDDFAAVTIGFTLHVPDLNRVAPNYFSLMTDCIARLRDGGCRRIGFAVTTQLDERSDTLWRGGYSVAGVGLKNPPVLMTEKWDRAGLLAWYTKYKPDGIVTVSVGFQKIVDWLAEEGVRVPQQVKVANLDLRAGAGEAGMEQDLESEGKSAVEVLLGKLERSEFGLQETARTVLIKGKWRNGWSA